MSLYISALPLPSHERRVSERFFWHFSLFSKALLSHKKSQDLPVPLQKYYLIILTQMFANICELLKQ